MTKKVILAVPDDKKAYKPDAKARTAGELAWHIATAEVWFLDGILKGEFGMEGEPAAPATVAAVADWYETNMNDRLRQVAELPADKLARVVPFFGMQLPSVAYLSFMTHHTAHHRGQLAAYIRPMGGKVPSIYGGSADEPFQMEANA
jgi:uncharacterized damage-inducible protein DinB